VCNPAHGPSVSTCCCIQHYQSITQSTSQSINQSTNQPYRVVLCTTREILINNYCIESLDCTKHHFGDTSLTIESNAIEELLSLRVMELRRECLMWLIPLLLSTPPHHPLSLSLAVPYHRLLVVRLCDRALSLHLVNMAYNPPQPYDTDPHSHSFARTQADPNNNNNNQFYSYQADTGNNMYAANNTDGGSYHSSGYGNIQGNGNNYNNNYSGNNSSNNNNNNNNGIDEGGAYDSGYEGFGNNYNDHLSYDTEPTAASMLNFYQHDAAATPSAHANPSAYDAQANLQHQQQLQHRQPQHHQQQQQQHQHQQQPYPTGPSMGQQLFDDLAPTLGVNPAAAQLGFEVGSRFVGGQLDYVQDNV
jgi:hypothetical protein